MTSRTLARFALAVSLCSFSVHSLGAQSKPKHIKNEQLLTDALAENGVGAAPAPWHIKARFETFDEAGKHKATGTFEEWWFGPKSYKTVFTADDLHQTNVATSAGLFRSGDQAWPGGAEALVPQLITSPLSIHAYDPKRNDLTDEMRSMSAGATAKFRCVFLLRKPAPDEPAGGNLNADLNVMPVDCFEPDSAILRYKTEGGSSSITLFNDIVRYENHNVAKEIQTLVLGKPFVTIHVSEVGPIAASVTAPAPAEGSAGPLTGRVVLADPLPIIGGKLDIAPTDFRSFATDSAVIKIVVGKDGKVIEAIPVSGSPDLGAKAAKGVRKLIFAPFMILDTPVEAEFTFNTAKAMAAMGAGGGGRR